MNHFISPADLNLPLILKAGPLGGEMKVRWLSRALECSIKMKVSKVNLIGEVEGTGLDGPIPWQASLWSQEATSTEVTVFCV